jgi:hypothetical protein
MNCAKKFRQSRQKVSGRELSSFELTDGMMRALIYNNEVQISSERFKNSTANTRSSCTF